MHALTAGLTPERLDDITAQSHAATYCPEQYGGKEHVWTSSSFTHIECGTCRYARPRGERAGETRALIGEVKRLQDLFERLSAAVTGLDFDASESALPRDEDEWIEFVRGIHERAEKIMEEY